MFPSGVFNVPLHSMTSFASREMTLGDSQFRWDIRSVNARGLDVKLRLPSGFDAMEATARNQAKRALSRGSVSIGLHLQASENRAAGGDMERVQRQVDLLCAVREALDEAGIPVAPATGEALATALGSEEPQRPEFDVTDESSAALLHGLDEALDRLILARRAEGEELARVISNQLSEIEDLIRDAQRHLPEARLALRDRVLKQINDLAQDPVVLSEQRLEQEVALLAGRADVREEIDRIGAHLTAARTLIADAPPVGRKLEFLTQEFHREANTLCSKAATPAMTRIGLGLKTVIDQMREQAANVE